LCTRAAADAVLTQLQLQLLGLAAVLALLNCARLHGKTPAVVLPAAVSTVSAAVLLLLPLLLLLL
jgi:hypothetical protein